MKRIKAEWIKITGKVLTQRQVRSNYSQTVTSDWVLNYVYSGSGVAIPTVKAKGYFKTP